MLQSPAGGENMSKETGGWVLSALKEYEQDPAQNDKKAILLTAQGGYFLYGNRFCGISEYELELCSESLQLQGKTVPRPLFLSVRPGSLRVMEDKPCHPNLVSLIFQIRLEEDEPLRGILFALEQEAQLALFCDEAIESLYRLSRKADAQKGGTLSPDEELLRRAEQFRLNDLHCLTGLYFRGENLKSLIRAFE